MIRSKLKPEYLERRDGRVELRGTLYNRMRSELCDLANQHCEMCGRFVGLASGEVHHVNGRGGGRRDDRIVVDGKRNLRWACGLCHRGQHVSDKVIPEKMSNEELRKVLGL
jgi:hypothetical protein